MTECWLIKIKNFIYLFLDIFWWKFERNLSYFSFFHNCHVITEVNIWSTFSQHLLKSIWYIKMKRIFIIICSSKLNFLCFDENHEFVVFWIFGDKVCLWNSGYVNISRMVLILEWLARRLASLYSITCLNIYWQRIWMKIETFFTHTRPAGCLRGDRL